MSDKIPKSMSDEAPQIPGPNGEPYLGDEKLQYQHLTYRYCRPAEGIFKAPPWWPHFVAPSFSEEELWLFESFCKKMVADVEEANEPLTPVERWKATREHRFGDLDRPFQMPSTFNILPMRSLDCFSDAVKPGYAAYWYPKLYVMGHLAFNAKFNFDCPQLTNISYGEQEACGDIPGKPVKWGPYIHPASPWGLGASTREGKQITKDDVDWYLEYRKTRMADPWTDGSLAAYMWAIKKTREFMMKHGAYDVKPILANACGGIGTMYLMLGWKEGLKCERNDPDLCEKLAGCNTDYLISINRAVWDILDPSHDIVWICDFPSFGLLTEGSKRAILKSHPIIVKALPQFMHLDGFDQSAVLPFMLEHGCISLGTWEGGTPIEFLKKNYPKYHKLYGAYTEDTIVAVATKTPEVNAANVKANIDAGAGPGYTYLAPASDPWSKIENLEIIKKTATEYGRKKWDELKKVPGALEWPKE
jgi:hypothetical protein